MVCYKRPLEKEGGTTAYDAVWAMKSAMTKLIDMNDDLKNLPGVQEAWMTESVLTPATLRRAHFHSNPSVKGIGRAAQG